MKKTHGFTLIEVLVAVVIISTALLGLVGMQTAGMKNTISSYNRTQATQLAYGMADRMRANRADATLGTASTYITTTTFPTSPVTTCQNTFGCTPAQMAANDLYEWNLDLTDTTRGLAKVGEIKFCATPYVPPTCNAPASFDAGVFSISVTWGEGRDDNKDGTADTALSFRTDFQL